LNLTGDQRTCLILTRTSVTKANGPKYTSINNIKETLALQTNQVVAITIE